MSNTLDERGFAAINTFPKPRTIMYRPAAGGKSSMFILPVDVDKSIGSANTAVYLTYPTLEALSKAASAQGFYESIKKPLTNARVAQKTASSEARTQVIKENEACGYEPGSMGTWKKSGLKVDPAQCPHPERCGRGLTGVFSCKQALKQGGTRRNRNRRSNRTRRN